MTNKEKRRFGVARLRTLKDAAIVLDLETMDVENDLALYDTVFHAFARGDLDNQFESVVFEDMSEDERVELLSLVKDYRGLCFYNGKGEYWLDSLEGVPISDYELITYSIFDNFDYLLELAKRGEVKVLEQLSRFQNTGYINSSVIEYLRRSNINDKVLETVLIDMSSEDSLYNIFTDDQKTLLLGNPFGNLYTYENDEVEIISPIRLAIDLYVDSIGQGINFAEESIEDVVRVLAEFLKTADIDSDIVSRSDEYVSSGVLSKEVKNIKYDDVFDYLKKYTGEYSSPYSGDSGIKRI